MRAFLLVALFVAIALPRVADAQICAPRPGLDFGGLVGGVFQCLNGTLFNITWPPKFFGLYFFQPPISQLCKWWVPPHPGQWTLGKYLPGACCLVLVPTPGGPVPICLPTPIRGTVQMMGVSR